VAKKSLIAKAKAKKKFRLWNIIVVRCVEDHVLITENLTCAGYVLENAHLTENLPGVVKSSW